MQSTAGSSAAPTPGAGQAATLDKPWRSILFVPVNVKRFVDRAHERGADAIELDLEDSVAASEKGLARQALPAAVERITGFGQPVVVRINRPWSIAIADLRAAVRPGVRAIELPKVSSAGHVSALDEAVSELEAEQGMPLGEIRFLIAIEDPAGLLAARDIGSASKRNIALTLGSEDFAARLGVAPTTESLSVPHQLLVLAATACHLYPYGLIGSLANYTDTAELRATATLARRLGFVGASAVHPRQVPILNEAFVAPDDAVRRARAILATLHSAALRGSGAASFEGQMIDEAHAAGARRLLNTYGLSELP